MCNYSFFKQILFVATVILFVSCDKEYNEIGADLIGQNNFDLKNATFEVVAYNQKIEPIQSNNLPVNALGIYENSAFGTTTASFVTQVSLATVNPAIGANPIVKSVVLTIPYFSTLKTTNADGSHVYELDSIYGDNTAKIKLSIYESGYFLRDLDPVGGFQNAQKYYTNQNADFETFKNSNRLNDDSNIEQNDAFFFNPAEHVVTSTDGTTTRTAPGMQLNLNKEMFQNRILKAPLGKLATNDVFKEYFRGLYFKVEKSGSDSGSLAMMDFSKGVITITYEDVTSATDATRVDKPIILNLSGNTVSLLNNENKDVYSDAINKANPVLGDEKLYLKGGEGSMAVISLFGADNFGADGLTGSPNSVADELDIIRKNGWLINEAKLVFHIDADAMIDSHKPQRIYLYDMTNNLPISDYFNDFTSGTTSKNGKLIFDGILNKTKSTYTIRITNHIRNLINDATKNNVKLGVVVTEDINTIAFSKFKDKNIFAPTASVMNPLGTILHGSKSTVPVDKRLKLEIYYTKPN
jgi:hypothetical protein